MQEPVTLRPARPVEADALSDLAMRSKAHWGYGQELLEACREELAVHPSQIESSRVVVGVRGEAVSGFSVLDSRAPTAELVALFVDPRAIGTGVGRALFEDAVDAARRAGCEHLRIESDPHASSFYRALGARKVGEVPSGSVERRMLPLLEVDLASPRSEPTTWSGR